LVSKRITKEEGNQINEAPIHVENMNGGIIESPPFLRSNFPKWTDPENLRAANVNDGSMKTNGVKDSDQTVKLEGAEIQYELKEIKVVRFWTI
jgi:hypothetical protein